MTVGTETYTKDLSIDVVDNSLSALSFDFLGGGARGSAAPAPAAVAGSKVAPAVGAVALAPSAAQTENIAGSVAEQVGLPAAEPCSPEKEETAQTVVLAQGERLVRVVSAPRRRAWGLWYGLRTVILVLLAFCAGSIILTLILNPDLTFAAAVQLLTERIGNVFRQLKEYLGW